MMFLRRLICGVGPARSRYRDRGVRQLGILADLQAGHGLQTDQEDQQADHQCQHRPADEDVGEGHVLGPDLVIPANAGI